MRALSASVIRRPCSQVSHGHFSGIEEVDSSLLYPYVFVAGLNKHDTLLGFRNLNTNHQVHLGFMHC